MKKVIKEYKKVKSLTIEPFYDLHGMIINEDKIAMKNVDVKLVLDYTKNNQLQYIRGYINEEEYSEMEITGFYGDENNLIIRGCSGAG